MKKTLTGFVICFLLSLPALLKAQTTTVPAGWKKHLDTAYNFVLYYPADWTLRLPGTNTRFFITTKLENDADAFAENLNCVARTLQQKDFTISSVKDAVIENLAANLKDFKLISSDYSTWNASQMLTIDYTCTKEQDGKKYSIHILQKIAVAKGILFTFTYTAETDHFAKYEETARKVIRLIRLN